jgi:hypothetical protein
VPTAGRGIVASSTTVNERESSQVKRKSIPRLLQLTYAHKRKQAKDKKRSDCIG